MSDSSPKSVYLEGEEGLLEIQLHDPYTQEHRKEFARIIQEFNVLFYKMYAQTWCNTRWREVPVLKPSTDLWIYQELISRLKPDLIIETGTFWGGSSLFMRDVMNLENPMGKVISIDIDHSNIPEKVKDVAGLILWNRSSVDPGTIADLKDLIDVLDLHRVMVILDSDHEKDHVLKELELYAPLVTKGMVLIVEDTNNHPGPIAAINEWYGSNKDRFKPDHMCEKFMLTFNRDGYFECIA